MLEVPVSLPVLVDRREGQGEFYVVTVSIFHRFHLPEARANTDPSNLILSFQTFW